MANRKAWKLGKRAFQNIQKYGATTWYDWCCLKWGTKWNAYGYEPGYDYERDFWENGKLHFKTANSAPSPVIMKLSKLYPQLIFEHSWVDSLRGQSYGEMTCKNGIVTHVNLGHIETGETELTRLDIDGKKVVNVRTNCEEAIQFLNDLINQYSEARLIRQNADKIEVELPAEWVDLYHQCVEVA